MASQRITVAKLAGASAEIVAQRFREWSATRQTGNSEETSAQQWPPHVHQQANAFVDGLRAHSLAPPVLYFVEWTDLWSMGELFDRWLTPPDGPPPLKAQTGRFDLYACVLSDDRRLARYLKHSGPQQLDETSIFIKRLREAIRAWKRVVKGGVLVVVREVVEASVDEAGAIAAMQHPANWLS